MTDPGDGHYSGSGYWDEYHTVDVETGWSTRNTERKWLSCFLPILAAHRSRAVLDLGCGLGYDALALARQGFRVTGLDHSPVAIGHAQAKAAAEGLPVRFEQADVAGTLAFPADHFDAVISNMTLHMFPEPVARQAVAEVKRCLKPGGLFLFHVNSTEDIPYRTERQRPAVKLGPNFYRLGKGQTMRFFDEACCRQLVAGWTLKSLEHVRTWRLDGEIQKCAWRGVAQKPGL
jgi:SAM-dependent methyltransferase